MVAVTFSVATANDTRSFRVDVSGTGRPIAKMEAYMSQITQEQWDTYAKSGVSTRYMVTSPSGADTLTKWSATTDRQTLIRA